MAARGAESVPGVIDSLSEGFAQVNRVLWVLLFPIGLDALFAFAPRITLAPLVDRWLALASQALESGQTAQVAGQSVEQLRQMLAASPLYDLLSLLAWNLANASVPAVGPLGRPASSLVLEATGFLPALGLVVALQAVSLLLGSAYLGSIGEQVRDGRVSLRGLAGRVGRYWLRFVVFSGVVLGIILGLSIPLAICLGILTLVAPVVASVVYTAVTVAAVFAGIWMLVYLFFLVDAVIVGDLGALAAVRSSILVVRRNFGPCLGLIGLTLIIALGMQVIWSALGSQPWGLAVAVVGNAYIASGLNAASMFFYRNRAAPR